jgi:hypothetical protein
MKQMSQSISNSMKSLPGRWTKVTTLGCILALVFLGATSAQPKVKGTARPFTLAGIISFTPESDFGGTFGVVGTATHLGKFVGNGSYEVTGVSDDYSIVYMHVVATWTAANGDTITTEIPEWIRDFSVEPATSSGTLYITRGTGRFANASGSWFGDISPAPVTPGIANIFTAEGTISY